MGIHVKSLNDLASIDTTMDSLAKAFQDFNNPKTAEKPVRKTNREKAFDELDAAMAVLNKAAPSDPAPASVAKAMTQVRPKMHIREALGDQSLGVQNADLAKSADTVYLYGTMASQGTMEAANAKAVNGQVLSKSADDEDEIDDPIGGLQI